jgi:hypothetical protein
MSIQMIESLLWLSAFPLAMLAFAIVEHFMLRRQLRNLSALPIRSVRPRTTARLNPVIGSHVDTAPRQMPLDLD